ncbi:hypothetical protein [Candidatus Uabimicrobium sp. HlEnr_7]|uniref:hypothetical protein n=1 Tax=Candidatus Uabimicrobium helgolandensis TaxID=3095367 RepID=UPI003558C399
MLRSMIICMTIFLLLVSCRKQEVCCDIDSVAGIGWPSAGYSTIVENTNQENTNEVYIPQPTNFDSSTIEMQPDYTSEQDEANEDNTENTWENNTTENNVAENNVAENNVAENNVIENNVTENNVTENNNENSWEDNTTDANFPENANEQENSISDATEKPEQQSLFVAAELLAPAKSYIYNLFSYEIKVRNTSDKPLKNITIKHTIPDNLTFFSTTGNGQRDGQQIVWTVDEVSPFASRSYKVTANGQKTGIAKLVANITLDDGSTKKVKKATMIDASAGLKINHLDTVDPVEVDTTTIYQIEITNQGNKNARELKVVDTIPSESTFVNAQVKNMPNIGHEVKGKTIIFSPIPSLSPGQKIVFEVEVEVIDVGDLINTIEVSTLDFGKTIKSQEGTKSFQD